MRFRILCELRRESCLPFHIRRQEPDATLMYLARMDIYDIMKITMHSPPVKLKKFIKADQLEVVEKTIDKYDYFD